MQQELKHKDIELRELQERYAGIGELYQITVDAINKSDQSDSILAMLQKWYKSDPSFFEAFKSIFPNSASGASICDSISNLSFNGNFNLSQQLKQSSDLRVNQLLSQKEVFSNEIDALKEKVKQLVWDKKEIEKERDELEDKFEQLTSDYATLQDHGKLDRKEFDLKIEILNYEKQKSVEEFQSHAKELTHTNSTELNRVRRSKDEELQEMLDTKQRQIEEMKKTHINEKQMLENRIATLQLQIKDVINNIRITGDSYDAKCLDSILSEKESDFSSTNRQKPQNWNISIDTSLKEEQSSEIALRPSDMHDQCSFNASQVISENWKLKTELQYLKNEVLAAKDEDVVNLNKKLHAKQSMIDDLEKQLKYTQSLLKELKDTVNDLQEVKSTYTNQMNSGKIVFEKPKKKRKHKSKHLGVLIFLHLLCIIKLYHYSHSYTTFWPFASKVEFNSY